MKPSVCSLIVTLFALSSSVSALAGSQESLSLRCEGLQVIEAIGDFGQIENYFPMDIQEVTSVSATLEGSEGRVSVAGDRTLVDFTDGDQISVYTFASSEFKALLEGQVNSLDGTYEDGFYWIDGYNTRAKFLVRCSK